ncbi:MAG: DUF4097 family beta strand repeat protein [Clostridia bacterium]|nr:DUF4097 family beta strand repeat protein [Clostridia bacterium]
MKKSIIWIVTISVILLVVGILLYSLANPCELETHEYEIEESFKDIKITTDTADIQFIPSKSPNSFIVCEEEKNEKHSVIVKENTLRIEVDDNNKWYEDLGINFCTPKITVYLGESEYGNISLKTDTGNILLDNIIANGKLATEIDTGDVNFESCDASELFIKIDTGNVLINDVITTGKLAIETDTGDVNFEACDASEVFIKTDTGNVTGSFLTDKIVFAESDTGKIDIPKVIADEKCEIITDTGNIKITIEQ